MNIKKGGVILCGMLLALDALANPIADATYAKFMDRAGALLPGRTVVELDLTHAGRWEVAGGQKIAGADGVAFKAESNTVELAWHGEFLPARRLPVRLELSVDTAVPARAMFHAGSDGAFKKTGDWMAVEPGKPGKLGLTIYAPPHRRYGDRNKGGFDGFKMVVTGKELAGQTLQLRSAQLAVDYCEGYFRHTLDVPAGDVWEAVADVGACVVLYVNGARVDDESIVLPRPIKPSGGRMYTFRRVPLRKYIKPGRNVLGIYRPVSANAAPAAWLCGSIVMASGARIPLDTGTNWVWNRTAPDNWFTMDYDDAGWLPIKNHADMPRELGWSSYYKGSEAVSSLMSNFGLSYQPRGIIPSYAGVIKLRNPADKKLYFNETENFQLEVFIPPGFKDQNPELAWAIYRYDGPGAEKNGMFMEVARGNIKDFQSMDGSLAGEINSARLARGIYVFTSRLLVNGAVVEERDPEMMVVTGKVKMPETAGDTLEQGMDLKLEKVIDFTNPHDPHPWFETDGQGPIPSAKWGTNYYHTVDSGLIVERNGLKYRTTRPVSRAQFSYQVDFAHPGDWYLMVLEYPDDAERWIGVTCNADSRTPIPAGRQKPEELYSGCSKCGPAIWTGGKYPNTGKMLEMKWIYRPDPGGHAINVMSLLKDTEAAAARLRIYHIAGRLPALDTGAIPVAEQRRFGMLTERTYPWENGIYNLFSSFDKGAVQLRGDTGAGRFSNNAVLDGCEHLRLLEDAASHFAEYMRFAGQNLHTMGCFQYSDANTASQYITGDPRIHDSSENMLARVLAANDLMFYASVEFICSERLGEMEVSPDWYFADRAGQRAMNLWANKPLNLNFLHPQVEAEMLELARQLALSFKHQPNFLGINWTTYFSGFWIPSFRNYTYPYDNEADPLGNGYDDLTIRLFEKDTGIKVPNPEPRTLNPSASSIHEQRYQFLTSDQMKPVWLAWRARKMAEFFAKVNRVIGEVRPGLETVAGCYLNTEHIREWHLRDIKIADYLEQWGWNPAAFEEQKGVWLMPWLPVAGRYQPASQTEDYAFAWQWNKQPEFYGIFAGLPRRAIMLHAGWIEVERIAAHFPYRAGWPRPYQQTMMAQQREEMALEPYVQAMIGMDPQMVMNGFTDVSPYIGVEGAQRKFARVLRRLPWGKFEPVLDTGLDSNLALRALRQGDDYLFYVANPGYWPIKGTVTMAGAGKVMDMVSGRTVAMKNGVMPVTLDPFGIAAFRASPSEISDGAGTPSSRSAITITAWSTDPVPEQDLAHMRGILRRAQDAAGKPGNIAGFLGYKDHAVLTNTIQLAEGALAGGRYAATWAALTDAPFWAVLFEKMPRLPADMLVGQQITLMRIGAGRAAVLDGKLNDLLWGENARMTGPFVGADREYPPARTMARMGWAGSHLCLAFECLDAAPANLRAATSAAEAGGLWDSGDDMVAFTIMPDGKNAYQFAINAAGVQAARRLGETAGVEFAPQWQAAVKHYDWGWIVEVLIDPRAAFGAFMPNNGEWKFNLHRLFRSNQQPPASWTYTSDWQGTNSMGALRVVPYRR